MDRITGMEVFTQVVEAGSFSAAARRLDLSRSAVSKHLAHLEDRLGAQLLRRTTRRLSLTDVGTDFYQRCAQILQQVEEAEVTASEGQANPRGLLRVNAPMTFGQLHLAPAIGEFVARFPEVQLDVALDDRMVDLLAGGFDVAVRIAPLSDSSLIARRLATNRLVVCGAPSYFASYEPPRTPADLVQHNCLSYTNLPSYETWRFRGARREHSVRVSGSLRSNNGDLLTAAALAGVGLVRMPTFIVGREIERGLLRTALDEYEDRSTAIWAVYPPARHLAKKVRAFVDFLVSRFSPHPYWDQAMAAEAGRAETPRLARRPRSRTSRS